MSNSLYLTLDLVKIPSLSLKGLTKIEISFENHPKYKLEVRIEDRFHSLSRAYKYNKFGYSGPKMDLDLSRNMFRYFAVKFTQNKMTNKDPRKRCKNYTKTSYNDCDEEFIKTELGLNYPPGFLPIWATANLSLVTTAISTCLRIRRVSIKNQLLKSQLSNFNF